MAIHVTDERIFILETKNTHYVLGVDKSERNRHLYWGPKCHISDYSAQVWDGNDRDDQLGTAKQEYAVFGGIMHKEYDLKVKFSDACREIDLKFDSADVGENTLTLKFSDKVYPLSIALKYQISDVDDIITRWAEVTNTGSDKIEVERIYSAELTLPSEKPYYVKNTNGSWGGEYEETETLVKGGNLVFDNKSGTSGQCMSPYFIAHQGADENVGDVYFASLAYGGNFKVNCFRDSHYTTRVLLGVSDHDFKWFLRAGETFVTPKVFCGYTYGFGEMSRQMHRFTLRELLPKQFADKPLPVLYNSWEATGFGVNVEQQKALAARAAEVGVELFVMDDGWFGNRHSERAGLGDWYVNSEKFPNGIDELIECVNGYGMDFGLWFEPEMVNPDSDLFREHPDWAYHYDTRTSHEQRCQLVLNLTIPEVAEYVFNSVDKMLENHNIKYVKWDYNRSISEMGAQNLECPQEAWYRHAQAYYAIADRLKAKHPDVAFESCSSGGGRSDHGALSHFDQVWTSDNTDAVDRMMMQKWFTYLRPAKVMRAWVTDTNYYNKPMPLDFKFNIAMQGSLGLGGNLSHYSQEDLDICKRNIAFYKEIRNIIQFGDLYRTLNPDDDEMLLNTYVTSDKKEAISFLATAGTRFMKRAVPIRFEGLDDNTVYEFEFEGMKYQKSGLYLKNVGIPAVVYKMGYNKIIRFKAI